MHLVQGLNIWNFNSVCCPTVCRRWNLRIRISKVIESDMLYYSFSLCMYQNHFSKKMFHTLKMMNQHLQIDKLTLNNSFPIPQLFPLSHTRDGIGMMWRMHVSCRLIIWNFKNRKRALQWKYALITRQILPGIQEIIQFRYLVCSINK